MNPYAGHYKILTPDEYQNGMNDQITGYFVEHMKRFERNVYKLETVNHV